VKALAIWVLLGALALGAAACGGANDEPSANVAAAEAPPPTLGPEDLPELTGRYRVLRARDVAAEAFQPDELAVVLEEGGYVGGSEREFSGHTDSFDRVLARTLRFADGAGARAYLGWLEANPEGYLGFATAEPPPTVGEDGFVIELERCGTCKKELPTYVVAWRRDEVVAFLLAAGRGASRDRLDALAGALDARIAQ
jgi:hypothetical protein